MPDSAGVPLRMGGPENTRDVPDSLQSEALEPEGDENDEKDESDRDERQGAPETDSDSAHRNAR